MTFSEFAKVLFPYCSMGKTQPEFVLLLTDKIMSGQPGRGYGADNYVNPLRKKCDRALSSYFSGERSIAGCDARVILARINLEKFQTLFNNCSVDALDALAKDVSEKLNADAPCDIGKYCAELFVGILKDIAITSKK